MKINFLFLTLFSVFFFASANAERGVYVKNGLVYDLSNIIYKVSGFDKEICKKDKNQTRANNLNNIVLFSHGSSRSL